MDFLQPRRLGKDAFPEKVDNHRQHGANEKEPEEVTVHCPWGEETAWAEGAPNHAGVEVGAGEGAGEAVRGIFSADIWDMVEGPVEDGDLAKTADNDADGLHEEKVTRGNLGYYQLSDGPRQCLSIG